MKNLNIKAFVYILVVGSVAIWAGLLYLLDLELSSTWDALKQLPTVISIDLGLGLLFVKWGWKYRIFQGWLILFPVIEGTWQGNLQTTWKDPETGNTPGPIPIILVIKQSFLETTAVMHSQEMTSRSYATDLLIDGDRALRRLVYTYTSTPHATVRYRSTPHDGTTVLDIVDNPNRMLRGTYWTDRKTTGNISLTFRSHELLEQFPDDLIPNSDS